MAKNKIDKRKAADKYASIYEDMYKKIARMAFLDGMVFWDMVRSGAVSEDMLNEDFFLILSDSNNKKDEL